MVTQMKVHLVDEEKAAQNLIVVLNTLAHCPTKLVAFDGTSVLLAQFVLEGSTLCRETISNRYE